MKAKPVVPRELANPDIDDAAVHAAVGFIDALEQAYAHIGRHPATGSPRYAHELNLPGLRFWPLAAIPTLCSTSSDRNTLMSGSVLHGQRDIPAWMQGFETI